MNFLSSLLWNHKITALVRDKASTSNRTVALYKKGHLVNIPDFVQKEIDRSIKKNEATMKTHNSCDYKLRLVIKNALRDVPQFSEKKKNKMPEPDDNNTNLIVPLLLGIPFLSLSCYMFYSFLRRRV